MVQLFDDIESRAETVAGFLLEGWRRGEALLVGARPETWAAVSSRLAERGCAADRALAEGRLVVLDAATTLGAVVRNGHPVLERFRSSIAEPVERLSKSSGKPVRIYGELVDILAAQCELRCARQLEGLWNSLAARCPVALLCGYTSGHFGDPQSALHLRQICGEHDRVETKTCDLLGSWLVEHCNAEGAMRRDHMAQ